MTADDCELLLRALGALAVFVLVWWALSEG